MLGDNVEWISPDPLLDREAKPLLPNVEGGIIAMITLPSTPRPRGALIDLWLDNERIPIIKAEP